MESVNHILIILKANTFLRRIFGKPFKIRMLFRKNRLLIGIS